MGTKTVIPRVNTAPHDVETPTHLLLIGAGEASGRTQWVQEVEQVH